MSVNPPSLYPFGDMRHCGGCFFKRDFNEIYQTHLVENFYRAISRRLFDDSDQANRVSNELAGSAPMEIKCNGGSGSAVAAENRGSVPGVWPGNGGE
jgi:hypothetical protein